MACAKIDCDEAKAGIHGFAWIAETEETWLQQSGASKAPILVKKARPKKGTPEESMLNGCKIKAHLLYRHLRIEGQKALIEWFGPAKFCDMQQNGILPATATPTDKLDHPKLTCGTLRNCHRCMIEVEKSLQEPHDPSKGVEIHLMRLDESFWKTNSPTSNS